MFVNTALLHSGATSPVTGISGDFKTAKFTEMQERDAAELRAVRCSFVT